ncbi:hypothetical protein KM043_009841 [Ampulex compressa]|nr:hypothetical protein KM043_009841 [Ampulex compressa]
MSWTRTDVLVDWSQGRPKERSTILGSGAESEGAKEEEEEGGGGEGSAEGKREQSAKDIEEERPAQRHGSRRRNEERQAGMGERAEEGWTTEDSRRMGLWKQKQKPVSLAQGCLPESTWSLSYLVSP